MAYSSQIIENARKLYLQRHTPREIKNMLGLAGVRIIYYWATKFEWYLRLDRDDVEEIIARRVEVLALREKKTAEEMTELDRLIGHHVDLMALRNDHTLRLNEIKSRAANPQTPLYHSAHDNADESFAGPQGQKNKREKKPQPRRANSVDHLKQADFDPVIAGLYQFQKILLANKHKRRRNILKARQIGATYYFAFEAFMDAVLTGNDQLFLSASKRQSLVFRSYIVKIALKYFDIQIKGQPVRLSNGAELHFLATNPSTAQSNSGNLYIDEYMWIGKFALVNAAATAMMTRNRFRLTLFSTPSSKIHQGYALWNGDNWRNGSIKRRDTQFPSSEDYRDGGRDCPDGVWRYMVTLEDAVAGGIDDIDIEEIKNTYSAADYAMLYGCEFTDDKNSVFNFADLLLCGADTVQWQDYDPVSARPHGDRQVWCGFDPARTGDNATFCVISVPELKNEKYRVLEIHHWSGLSFNYMTEQIRTIISRFNVRHIAVDTTGIGYGVYEQVRDIAPSVTKSINYSVENKNRLVLKMLDIIASHRIEWDQERREIPVAFMSVKKTMTGSGNAMTFAADRTSEAGHADIFFSIAHAMDNEPLNYRTKRKSSWSIASG